ncbi:hypothetical protein CHUAL_002310 [Chamberlinius hualienensis]
MSFISKELYLGCLLYLWLLSAIGDAINNAGISPWKKRLQIAGPLKKYIYRREKDLMKFSSGYNTMAGITPRATIPLLVRVGVSQPLIQGRTYPDTDGSQAFSASSPYGHESPFTSADSSSYGSSYSQYSSSPSSYGTAVSSSDPSEVSYDSASSPYQSYSSYSDYNPYSSYYTEGTSDDFSAPSFQSNYFPGYISSGTPHGTQSEQSQVAASHFYTGFGSSSQSPSPVSTSTLPTSELEPLTNDTVLRQQLFAQSGQIY